MIYLDYTANAPVEPRVLEALCAAEGRLVGNANAKHGPGMELIRPLYCVHEEDIIAWKNAHELTFIQCACRFTENCTMCDNGGGGSKRQEVKWR